MYEQLKNIKPGEKYIEVKEKYIGQNGNTLTYEVTIYTCKKLLFVNKICKYTFPFYFKSKELIMNFFKYYDSFKFIEYSYINDFELKLSKNNKSAFIYMLCKSFSKSSWDKLRSNDIWEGYIGVGKKVNSSLYLKDKLSINDDGINQLYELEKEASKENTYGNVQLYKLQEF